MPIVAFVLTGKLTASGPTSVSGELVVWPDKISFQVGMTYDRTSREGGHVPALRFGDDETSAADAILDATFEEALAEQGFAEEHR